MGKKCKQCGVPLEGVLYKLIARTFFGVEPSKKTDNLCNKCESDNQACGCCKK